MARLLTINAATTIPFKSSNLALPPSPFTPLTPLSISPVQKTHAARHNHKATGSDCQTPPPPPLEPLHWLWQCHLCSRVYQLGVTRRCLDDGHYFCAGTTTIKKSRRTNKKIIRHKACASEFDYQGWKAWGNWRRSVVAQLEAAAALEDDNDSPLLVPGVSSEGEWMSGAWAKKPSTSAPSQKYWHKDCWNTCDYPSECRWGKQFSITSGSAATTPSAVPAALIPGAKVDKSTPTFDDMLLDVPALSSDKGPTETLEALLQQTTTTALEDPTRKPSMDDLLESVKRRKRRSAGALPSPLSSNPPSPTMP